MMLSIDIYIFRLGFSTNSTPVCTVMKAVMNSDYTMNTCKFKIRIRLGYSLLPLYSKRIFREHLKDLPWKRDDDRGKEGWRGGKVATWDN